MVKGRRVRAVVACNRVDDCCSPKSKRKGRRVVANATFPQKNIDNFFPVNKHFNGAEQENDCCSTPVACSDLPVDKAEMNGTDEYKDLDVSPVRSKLAILQKIFSPSTPHRIELCSESDDNAQEAEVSPVEEQKKVEKKVCAKKTEAQTAQSHKLTEYFPVRRSVRKTKKTVLEEQQRFLERALRSGVEDGLLVRQFDGKGRGVVAAKPFDKGDFVVEYNGELIDIVEAKKREQRYAQDQSAGCYMYYFKYNDQQYCIDATSETGRLGRLVNHSRNGNLVTRTVSIDGLPRLVLIAKTFIKIGDEVTYDYGDRSKESLQSHPWLAY